MKSMESHGILISDDTLKTNNDKRILRRMAANFLLDGEILYKKKKDQILLRCVDAFEAQCIIAEVHKGICGTHVNGHKMSRRIMRAGYYRLTLEKDYIQFARKCRKCQIYVDKIHVPLNELHVMTITWPFSTWGMDVIGQITQKRQMDIGSFL